MFKRLSEFIRHGIWQKGEQEYSSLAAARAVRGAKLLIYTARGFDRHQTAVRSAALSFYTVLSLVPILALVFAVFKGFGLETSFVDDIYGRFPQYRDALDLVFGFTQNLLARTRGGVVAVAGFVVLIWAVVQVFGSVEQAFNSIWEVKRSRGWGRKVSDYIAVIFVVPVLTLISNGIIAELRTGIASQVSRFVAEAVYVVVALVGVWVAFSLIYYLLPNTKVHFRSAAVSGAVASVAFIAFQEFYIYIQLGLSTYNAIYGTFAAIPLFLVWTQISWQILLFGGELSFAIQNIKRYEQESRGLQLSGEKRRRVAIAAMAVIARRFSALPSGATTSEDVASELDLPLRIVRDVLFDLENAGLVFSVTSPDDDKQTRYLPSRDVRTITIADVVLDVDRYETSTIDLDANPLLKTVGDRLAKIEALVSSSPGNTKIIDLI